MVFLYHTIFNFVWRHCVLFMISASYPNIPVPHSAVRPSIRPPIRLGHPVEPCFWHYLRVVLPRWEFLVFRVNSTQTGTKRNKNRQIKAVWNSESRKWNSSRFSILNFFGLRRASMFEAGLNVWGGPQVLRRASMFEVGLNVWGGTNTTKSERNFVVILIASSKRLCARTLFCSFSASDGSRQDATGTAIESTATQTTELLPSFSFCFALRSIQDSCSRCANRRSRVARALFCFFGCVIMS